VKNNLQIEYKRRREYLNTFKIPIYNKLILTYLIMLIIGSLLTTLPAFVFNICVFFLGKIIIHHQDVILYCRSLFGSLVDEEEEVPTRLAYIEKLLVMIGYLVQAFAIIGMFATVFQLVSMLSIQMAEPVKMQLSSPHGL
jgi:hypothetical protein